MSSEVRSSLVPAPLRAACLCLIAGYVDAIGYLDYAHVFAANMTGNTVLLWVSVAQGDWTRVATYAMTLAAFVVGGLLAEGAKRAGATPMLPLLVSGVPLVVMYLAGLQDNWALVALAFAMGLQGASVSRFENINVQTVVITSTLLKFAEAAIHRVFPTRSDRESPVPRLALPIFGASWLSYGLGAALSLAARPLGPAKLLLPLILIMPVALSEGRRD